MAATDDRSVLVIDDDRQLRRLFERWLEAEYEVLTAETGDWGLQVLDDSVDVVLLDRRMPGMTGDEVLEEIRDRGLDCRVAMVTAVDPGFDIMDMDFDDYVVKPVDRETLLSAVEALLARRSYDDVFEEFFEITAKLGVLETNHPKPVLESSDEYVELVEAHDRLAEELGQGAEELIEAGEYDTLFYDI